MALVSWERMHINTHWGQAAGRCHGLASTHSYTPLQARGGAPWCWWETRPRSWSCRKGFPGRRWRGAGAYALAEGTASSCSCMGLRLFSLGIGCPSRSSEGHKCPLPAQFVKRVPVSQGPCANPSARPAQFSPLALSISEQFGILVVFKAVLWAKMTVIFYFE